jgi:hypothetical protein
VQRVVPLLDGAGTKVEFRVMALLRQDACMNTAASPTDVKNFDQMMIYATSAINVVETATRVRNAAYRPQAIQHARRAYELVQELKMRRPLAQDQAAELRSALLELRAGLQRLGEPV